jgi:hypothetical protein
MMAILTGVRWNLSVVLIKKNKIMLVGQVLVAHTFNPKYSGGRDQEDCDLNPPLANSSGDPISKSHTHKHTHTHTYTHTRADGLCQG